MHELVKNFLNATNQGDTYYAYLRSPDDAQHLSADILAMLCTLDEKLQELRATYRAREGRELEILILSDHGNNHAGPAKRVEIRKFLKQCRLPAHEIHSRTPKTLSSPRPGWSRGWKSTTRPARPKDLSSFFRICKAWTY